MKRLYIVFWLLCLFSVVKAQQNVPKVTCIYCGGTGRAGYSFCLFCGGSGLMVDPQYQNQKAYDYGKSLGLCINGKFELANGNYRQAFKAFSEAMELENIEAIFFLGVCYELGMGVEVNHEIAYDCYTLAKDYGNANARAAVERIEQNGYWVATDNTRKNFCNNLKVLLDMQRNATIMNTDNYNDRNSNRSNDRSSSYNCSGCGGTGNCTSCKGTGKVMYDTGGYVGRDIKTITNCPVCKGSGKCGVCHGSGRIR